MASGRTINDQQINPIASKLTPTGIFVCRVTAVLKMGTAFSIKEVRNCDPLHIPVFADRTASHHNRQTLPKEMAFAQRPR